MSTTKRFGAGVLGATLIAGSMALFIAPGTASARCAGVGEPRTTTIKSSDGMVRGTEAAQTGTCNGNTFYQGTVDDVRVDGAYITAQFDLGRDGHFESWYSAGDPHPDPLSFSLDDTDSNSYARMCLKDKDDQTIIRCDVDLPGGTMKVDHWGY